MYQRNYRGKNFRKNRRDDREYQTNDISTFCVLNLTTGEVYNCRNMEHACKVGFGQNKRTRTQNWLVIYRDANCFICL